MRFIFNSFHVRPCWLSLTPHNVWNKVPTFPWRIRSFMSWLLPPLLTSSLPPHHQHPPLLQQCQVHLVFSHPTCMLNPLFIIFLSSWCPLWLGLALSLPVKLSLAIQQSWGHLYLSCRVLRAYLYSGKLYLLCLLAESLENSITYSSAKTVF